MKTQSYIGKKVVVRCNSAGVFYGTLAEFDSENREASLQDVRRIWYWDGAASLSQLAMEGVKNPKESKFTMIVPEMSVMEVIEIIPCTAEAIANLDSVAVWKR